ncbi:MAG: hypothetical protein ACOH2L_17025 [Devosia sp.]
MTHIGANRRPSEWRQLFAIAIGLLDQLRDLTGAHDFTWSLGGGTAMMIQIGHLESHDIDIFLDDAQLLGFLDPSKGGLSLPANLADYGGDGARFQKFAFGDLGEIDFILASALTDEPFRIRGVEDRPVKLEAIAEIIAKKIYHRGSQVQARDIFDLAAATRTHRTEVLHALRKYPDHVAATQARLQRLNPEFVASTIGQLMVMPDYLDMAPHSLKIANDVLGEVILGQ